MDLGEALKTYEPVALAAMKEEKEPDVALQALSKFYDSDKYRNDPIIRNALEDAARGLQSKNPTLSNSGVKEAIAAYGGTYEKIFFSADVSSLLGYLEHACTIPENAKKGILEHRSLPFGELAEKYQSAEGAEKEKIEKAFTSLMELKDLQLTSSYAGMSRETVEKNLQARYN